MFKIDKYFKALVVLGVSFERYAIGVIDLLLKYPFFFQDLHHILDNFNWIKLKLRTQIDEIDPIIVKLFFGFNLIEFLVE